MESEKSLRSSATVFVVVAFGFALFSTHPAIMPNNRKLTLKKVTGKDGVHPGSRKGEQTSGELCMRWTDSCCSLATHLCFNWNYHSPPAAQITRVHLRKAKLESARKIRKDLKKGKRE
jgi:hypothetical protein